MKAGSAGLFSGLAVALSLLAACAQQGPAAVADDAEDWVDCTFKDRSVGHVRMKDCETAGGLPSRHRIGPMVTYRLAVEWQGIEGPLAGTMTAPEYGFVGSFTLALGSIGRRCSGEFRVPKSPRGIWSADCGGGLTAEGTLYRYSTRQPIVGNGQDSEGNELDFEAWPN